VESSVLTVLFVVVILELVGIAVRFHAVKTRLAVFQRQEREWASLVARTPGPTSDDGLLIATALANANRELAPLRETVAKGGHVADRAASVTLPAERSDADFVLAQFVERMRERAKEHSVTLNDDERFGFSAYAKSSPEREHIPSVIRQQIVIERVLDRLFEARPEKLLFVAREQPRKRPDIETPAKSGEAAPVATSGPEIFQIDPAISLRVSGRIDSTAFRVGFVGSTETLRDFMARLANDQIPLVVRRVEVESMDGPVPTASKDGPLIARVPSRFSVTLEAIEHAASKP
jgi:hypothetical protein